MNNVIDISSDSLDFIKQQGGVDTIRLPWAWLLRGLANVPVAEANAPADTSLYQRHRYQNITLFIAPALVGQGLSVNTEGWWKLRHLYMEGSPLLQP